MRGLNLTRMAAASTAVAVLLAVGGRPASAQTYEISWWTVDSGGLNGATAGPYELFTTAGQPDAGGPFAGGPFALHSGYWSLVAGGAGGQEADLSATITDGQATAIPGTPVTYTMTVSNAGPDAVSGAWVFNDQPSLLGAAWTCSASPGSSCPASGTGGPNHFVDVAIGGVVTYSLTGTIQTSASGRLVNTILTAVPSGVSDPNPANNSATDTDTLTPQADLALVMSDSSDPVGPGLPFTYTVTLDNLGPSYSWGSSLTDTLPAGLTFSSVSGGLATCTHVSGTVSCDVPALEVGASQTVHIRVTLNPTTTGTLSNTAVAVGDDADPVGSNNSETETTTVGMRAQAELTHGSKLTADLESVGFAPDADFYRLRQEPHSSYEIVVDGTSGDIGGSGGVELRLLAADGTTTIAGGQTIGTRPSRSLRWINASSSVIDDQYVRVRSTECTIFCGPEDSYRLRMWETTSTIPRFNNSGSQVTVIIVQNAGWAGASARLHFWSGSGALLFEYSFFLPAKGFLNLNTSGFPELQAVGGTVTLASDAPYGTLVGKAVALEPATGFSFDSALAPKVR